MLFNHLSNAKALDDVGAMLMVRPEGNWSLILGSLAWYHTLLERGLRLCQRHHVHVEHHFREH